MQKKKARLNDSILISISPVVIFLLIVSEDLSIT